MRLINLSLMAAALAATLTAGLDIQVQTCQSDAHSPELNQVLLSDRLNIQYSAAPAQGWVEGDATAMADLSKRGMQYASSVAATVTFASIEGNDKGTMTKPIMTGLSYGIEAFAVRALSGSSVRRSLQRRQPRMASSMVTYAIGSLFVAPARSQNDKKESTLIRGKVFTLNTTEIPCEPNPPLACRQLLNCDATLYGATADSDLDQRVRTALLRSHADAGDGLGRLNYLQVKDWRVQDSDKVVVSFAFGRAYLTDKVFNPFIRGNAYVRCKVGNLVTCCGKNDLI